MKQVIAIGTSAYDDLKLSRLHYINASAIIEA
jgi:hypothetical protein